MNNVRINEEEFKKLEKIKEKTKIPFVYLLAEGIEYIYKKYIKKEVK